MDSIDLHRRRRFLKASAVMVAGAGIPFALSGRADAQDARVAQDIAVLNYALTLERLEADFYVTGLQRFGNSDFLSFPVVGLYDRLREIRDHEVAHVTLLTGVVRSLGGVPVVGGTFNFGVSDPSSFLRVAQLLENTGVSAYDGAVALIRTPTIQTAGATIATVEARHAAYLNLVNGADPFPAATDTPRTPTDIITAIRPFVVTAPAPER